MVSSVFIQAVTELNKSLVRAGSRLFELYRYAEQSGCTLPHTNRKKHYVVFLEFVLSCTLGVQSLIYCTLFFSCFDKIKLLRLIKVSGFHKKCFEYHYQPEKLL